MKNVKMGRPTEMPKDIILKLRIDEKTSEELDYCISKEKKNKSDIVRTAIHDYFKKLKER